MLFVPIVAPVKADKQTSPKTCHPPGGVCPNFLVVSAPLCLYQPAMLSAKKIAAVLLGMGLGLALPLSSPGAGPTVEVFNQNGSDGAGKSLVPLFRIPVQISVSVNGGYDENVNTTSSGNSGSIFTSANINAEYRFGTSRTQATLRAGTGLTYYPDVSDNRYDPNLSLDLTVNHQANRRLSVTGSIHASYQAEPDFATDLGLNRRAGNYFSSQDSISASYQWLPRFSTVSTYSISTVQYDGDTVAGAQDRVDHDISQSFRFLFLPVTTLVTDLRLSFADFDLAARGSSTFSLLGGIDHTFLPGLQGTLRVGAEFRSSEGGGRDEENVSPHVESSLSYAVTGRTTLSWTTSYSTEESDVPTSPGSQSFRTGLQASYSVTPRISSSVGFFYVHSENEASGLPIIIAGQLLGNPAFSEDSLDLTLTLNYAINRHLSVNAGYNRSEVDSEIALRSYSRNRYFGGLNFNF